MRAYVSGPRPGTVAAILVSHANPHSRTRTHAAPGDCEVSDCLHLRCIEEEVGARARSRPTRRSMAVAREKPAGRCEGAWEAARARARPAHGALAKAWALSSSLEGPPQLQPAARPPSASARPPGRADGGAVCARSSLEQMRRGRPRGSSMSCLAVRAPAPSRGEEGRRKEHPTGVQAAVTQSRRQHVLIQCPAIHSHNQQHKQLGVRP